MIDHKERIELSNEARRLLDDPILNYAFKKAKDNQILSITNSKPDDTGIREHAYVVLSAISEIETVIKALIREGDASKIKLNQKTIPKLKSLDR